MAKDVYTAIFHTGDEAIGNKGFIKWNKVNSIERCKRNILARYPNARFVNFYSKRTREKVEFTTFSDFSKY